MLVENKVATFINEKETGLHRCSIGWIINVNDWNGGGDKLFQIDNLRNVNRYTTLEEAFNNGNIIEQTPSTSFTVDDITIELNQSNEVTIKNIDFIIDDDNKSIDGSDTPMSDPHKELVTRAKVEQVIAQSTNWLEKFEDIDGDGNSDEKTLYPADPLVKKMEIVENTRGMNQIYIENSNNDNNTDNYTGASIVLTASNTPYSNQTFIAHHGIHYYNSYLAGRGAIQTDSSMIIGAYNSTDKQGVPSFVSFVCGDSYTNQKEIFKLTTNGLEMKLPDKKIYYEAGKTAQQDPFNYTNLRCNVDTGEIYAANSVELIQTSERFIITRQDVLNGYITLSNTPNSNSHFFVIYNGLVLDEDPSGDFTLSGNRIDFLLQLQTDDKVIVKYSY